MEINPDAIFIAEALDLERKLTGARSPLHGVPVVLKGNIETRDKMHTTAGALALEQHVSSRDAFSGSETKGRWCNYSRKNKYDRMGKWDVVIDVGRIQF